MDGCLQPGGATPWRSGPQSEWMLGGADPYCHMAHPTTITSLHLVTLSTLYHTYREDDRHGRDDRTPIDHEVVQTAWESKISCQDILSVRWDVIQQAQRRDTEANPNTLLPLTHTLC